MPANLVFNKQLISVTEDTVSMENTGEISTGVFVREDNFRVYFWKVFSRFLYRKDVYVLFTGSLTFRSSYETFL